MKLSVIVPVYNGEKTIEKCILSLINQDFDDMEILVINDGSDDNTVEIINNISKKYSSKKLRIINKKNQGLPQARKTGVANSNGDYIGFVDADDWVEPEMFSNMINHIDKYGYDIVCCDFSYDYKNKTDIHAQMLEEGISYSETEAMSAINYRYGIFPNMCNKVIKKELFENVTFLHGNFIGEDYSIIIQVLKNKCSVGVVKKPYYHYIQSAGSMGVGGYSSSQELGYYVYKRILLQIHKTYDKKQAYEYDNYLLNEFMGIVLAMGYNRCYDFEKIKWIQKFVRKRIIDIIKNEHNTLLCKGTSLVMCFSYKMVIWVFNLYRKYLVQWNNS